MSDKENSFENSENESEISKSGSFEISDDENRPLKNYTVPVNCDNQQWQL